MQSKIFVLSIIFNILAFSLMSQASTPKMVFDCKSSLSNEFLRMTVIQKPNAYLGYLVGTTQTAPQAAKKFVVSANKASSYTGVAQILKVTNTKVTDFSKAYIYTIGNFDDDLAGVRGVQFIAPNGSVVAEGMFFGWGGPLACQK